MIMQNRLKYIIKMQIVSQNRLLSLPKELIDYIYEYDDNQYHQKIYNKSLSMLHQKYRMAYINRYLSSKLSSLL